MGGSVETVYPPRRKNTKLLDNTTKTPKKMMELNKIYNEDCLEGMKRIPDGSVDMVLCDLPYGTTQLKWDVRLPFDKLWEQWLRVCKTNAAIVLFSSQPFTTDLINSNRKMFKYEIVWKKTQATGFFNAKKAPLRIHENIIVFYDRLPTYNPIKQQKKGHVIVGRKKRNSDYKKITGGFMGKVGLGKADTWEYTEDGTRYPTDVIEYSNWNGALFGNLDRSVKHPTQKPVDLCEYLIKTYTNEGDTVLDNCMGSGTTAVACINTGRNFIGFEIDEGYWKTSQQRIAEAMANKTYE